MELLSNRAVLLSLRTYLLFQSDTDGFGFGRFAPVGAIQPKEAVIEKKGHYSIVSKHQFNFFKKEYMK